MATSGIRGNHSQSQTNMPTSQENQRSSYAKVTQETVLRREQAIIIDSVEGIPVREYALAIAQLIEPQNILYISKISQGRVCLYVSSQDIADKLVNTHKTVSINTHSLEIRPLLSQSKRIIISNVPPVIPNSSIENKLREHNIVPISPISRIRAGINDTGFAHILSFRRQMYLNPDDVTKLPDSIQVTQDNVTYWIYLSAEKLTCFLCKEEGHLAKHCQAILTDSQDHLNKFPELPPQQSATEKPSNQHELSISSTPAQKPTSLNNNFKSPMDTNNKRRSLSTSTESSSFTADGKPNNPSSGLHIDIDKNTKAKEKKSLNLQPKK